MMEMSSNWVVTSAPAWLSAVDQPRLRFEPDGIDCWGLEPQPPLEMAASARPKRQ